VKVQRWDDLKVVLAVARGGTLTAAAATLGIDQTTVTRRVKAIERELGVTLFDRLRGGAELTEVGAAFVRTATLLEQGVLDLERQVSGGEQLLAGRVRLTLPETLAYPWMGELTALATDNPSLDIEVVVGNAMRNLARREADIAIRVTDEPAPHLVGRRFGAVATAIYGPPAYLELKPEAWRWIGWDAETALNYNERARLEHGAGAYALWVNSYLLLLEAARLGAGAVLLPCLTGEALPELARLTLPERFATVWILTHPDLHRSPRIRLVMERLSSWLESQELAITGGTSPSSSR